LKLTIYSKKDCHLCEEAKAILSRYASASVSLEEIDIETNPELYEKYRYEIPVIFLDDRKLFKYRVDEKKLRRALNRS
jgi:glutaredoxin